MEWINHHRLFTHIRRTDNILLILNLLLLLMIVFVPFPNCTSDRVCSAPGPAPCCGGLQRNVCNHSYLFQCDLALRDAQESASGQNADQHAVRAISNQYLFGPVLYAVAFGLAWISAPASIVLNLLLALFFAFPGRRPRSLPDA